MISTDDAAVLRDVERRRLRCLVEVRISEARELHADDFELVTPGGHVLTREQYLGRIGSGDIDYRRFEAASEIEVAVSGDLAVLRYRSLIDIAVVGQEAGPLECWHLDCYQRDGRISPWRLRWSQATSFA